MEQRALISNTGETNIEEELVASIDEITNLEKKLKNLFSVTEFLFDN
jgi:hypothetical protein